MSFGILGQMTQMALLNLRASRVKTLIVGAIVFLGAFLVVLGTSLIDSIDASMKSSITGSVAGHIQVYNDTSRGELVVMGDMNMEAPELEPLTEFQKVRETLMAVPNVKDVVPMGINSAIVSSGNTIDLALSDLRDAVRAGDPGSLPTDDRLAYDAMKTRVRRMVEVLADDMANVEKIQREGVIDTEQVAAVRTASTPEFWAGFDADPLPALEFLENKVAPLATDADLLFLRYVGTDIQAFQSAFSRMKIVDGKTIPPGQRGFLFSKFVYEEQVKMKVARRLDKIKDAIEERGSSIATDPELQRFVRENTHQAREVVMQMDPTKVDAVKGRLRDELGKQGDDLGKLLSSLFDMNDENWKARYQFFYREIAPHVDLYRVRIGDTLTIKAFTKTGYMKSLNLPVYGTFAFEGLEASPQAGVLNLMDLVSFRELYGFPSAEGRAEIAALRAASGATDVRRDEAEDVLFGGRASGGDETRPPDTVPEPATTVGVDIDKLLAGADLGAAGRATDLSYDPAEVKRGVALNAAVIVKDDRLIPQTMQAIEAAGKAKGLHLKAIDWQTASGLLGQFVNLARLVLFVCVLIIFIVALVIINNSLVMATLERIQEFGTLRAIGAQKRFIVGMLFIESLVAGVIFGGLGALAGAAVIGFLNKVGIPAFNDIAAFFFSGPRLHPRLGAGNMVVALVIVFIVNALSTYYPARLAIGVTPRQAMQSED